LIKLIEIKFPDIDPKMKLTPTINPIGKCTVSSIIKLTLDLVVLFCIPTNNNKNKLELNII
jgi:hypothetical protein